MNSKRSPGADLESKRPLFFLIGLSVALLLVIFIIQLKSEYHIQKVPDKTGEVEEGIVIPITIRDKPEPAVQKAKSRELARQVTEQVTKQVLKLDLTATSVDRSGEEEPVVDIGGEDELWRAEPVPVVLVQKLAVPGDCAGFTSRDEQLECLNTWLNTFIRENIEVPRIVHEMNLKDRIFITFIIDENGYLESVKAENGQYEVLRKEAERVFALLPRFRPAGQYGRTVKMAMTVPVNFK